MGTKRWPDCNAAIRLTGIFAAGDRIGTIVAKLSAVLDSIHTSAGSPTDKGYWPRERPAMYIYGTSQIHAAQPLNAPHRLTPTQQPRGDSTGGVDQLDISPEADFVAQARELPDIREDRVASIRAQIQSGTYETADKLDMALSRMLDEIA
jgi:negative regulator of flagellin synthesis FlgM